MYHFQLHVHTRFTLLIVSRYYCAQERRCQCTFMISCSGCIEYTHPSILSNPMYNKIWIFMTMHLLTRKAATGSCAVDHRAAMWVTTAVFRRTWGDTLTLITPVPLLTLTYSLPLCADCAGTMWTTILIQTRRYITSRTAVTSWTTVIK